MRVARVVLLVVVVSLTSASTSSVVDAPRALSESEPSPTEPVAAARVAPDPVEPATDPAPEPIATLGSPVLAPLDVAATYRYGPADHQLLDVFVPDAADGGRAPVLVYFHAGGWVAGARTDLPDIVAAQLARGWAVVSVDYALAPTHHFPEPVYDADLAVRWVRKRASALGLRADAIIAVGASAGGHLATWLAADPLRYRASSADLADVSSGIDAAVLLVAPIVMADLRVHIDTFAPAILAAYLGCENGKANRCTEDVLRDSDPSLHVQADPPPIYVLHGGQDDMFPASVHGSAIARAWAAAGGAALVDVAPFAGHNLDATNVDVAATERFLDALGRSAP